ncbi:hypothetical protein [Enterobacter hormaechei]|uniref:hypothetical protein n=1 Tax=Enterobacter hormaechei TaxID=158836 RepID=UPI00287474E6|nr:hypothetical protein [Enterobacter hormaechei]MDR9909351.1 hypothetical protein [Enterobacter hormaechei subsp. steigerwaltii]
MMHLPLPIMDEIEIFERCVRAYPDDFAQVDLDEALPIIKQLYADYHDCLTNQKIIDLKRSVEFGKFTGDKMKGFYHEQLVGQAGICRDEYSKLLASAPRKKCPMCSGSTATCLDHHAPKQTYYYFAISPKNLVPICTRCNEAKKNTMPNRLDKQFIHPYYDDFSKISWFEMEFTCKDPIEIIYRCKSNDNLSPEIQAKLKSHFTRLKLDELYGASAITIIEDMKETFFPYLETKDWDSVEKDIITCFNLVKRRPDSWEYALYSKLLSERWFIEGGFNNVE